MRISVRNLTKNFSSMGGNVTALDDVSFEVERGQFYTLLGPSGCGKSTTLRCIAGLEDPDPRVRVGAWRLYGAVDFNLLGDCSRAYWGRAR